MTITLHKTPAVTKKIEMYGLKPMVETLTEVSFNVRNVYNTIYNEMDIVFPDGTLIIVPTSDIITISA